jgi:hypothetical protein
MKQRQHDTEKLRMEGTGLWFLEDPKFVEWQDNAGSLWIEGSCELISRRLKSNLIEHSWFREKCTQVIAILSAYFVSNQNEISSSTVIKQLFADGGLFGNEDKSPTPPTVAFFYFDFRDKECQNVETALRSVVLQLSAHCPHPYRTLDEQYKSVNGQKLPSCKDLEKILQQILRELGRTYIVLDALDECNATDWGRLVNIVSSLRHWTETPLHVFFTSQTRQIFTESFEGVPRIALAFDTTQEDIRFFVANEIRTNMKLRKWQGQAEQIVDRVVDRSQGMPVTCWPLHPLALMSFR